MPTFNQLVRQGRCDKVYKSKAPVLQKGFNSLNNEQTDHADLQHYLVVKGNDLIQNSRYSLTLLEQKVILYWITRIKPTDEDFAECEFDMNAFCDLCGITRNRKNRKSNSSGCRLSVCCPKTHRTLPFYRHRIRSVRSLQCLLSRSWYSFRSTTNQSILYFDNFTTRPSNVSIFFQ